MKKIKLIQAKTRGVIPYTSNVPIELYNRLSKLSQDLKITKKAITITALEKLLDEIEQFGVEL